MDNQIISLQPRLNPFLYGHQTVEQTFLTSWNSSRIPHAWLLSGPKGIGKATLAFRIARFVLASKRDEKTGKNLYGDIEANLEIECDDPVFKRVASGGHADLMTLERPVDKETNRLKSSIPIESVRTAGDFLRRTASEGGWRVLVIDSADELNLNAANALLKILEEPPDKALILLVSHAPGQLLPTIHSRCCKIKMTSLNANDFKAIISELKTEISEEDIGVLEQLSEGCPGRALQLSNENGLALYSELVSLIRYLPDINSTALHKFGDQLARQGAEKHFYLVIELLAWWISRLARMTAKGNVIPDILPEEEGCAARLANQTRVDHWLEVWEKINVLARQTNQLNLDRKHVLINIFEALKGAARG